MSYQMDTSPGGTRGATGSCAAQNMLLGSRPWGRLVAHGVGPLTHELRSVECVIGRSRECDLRLPFAHISGRHCRIMRAHGNTAFVTDLSTNGTWVNNQRLHPGRAVMLNNGDELRLTRQDPILFLFEDFVRRQSHVAASLVPQDHPVFTQYDFRKDIGSGKFGTVFRAVKIITSEQVAIKVVDKQKNGITEFALEFMKREVDILKRVKHPNIVPIVDVFDYANILCIVLHYCEAGDLFEAVHNFKGFTEDSARVIFNQILAGVLYLHSNNILHRDLKPENILLEGKKEMPRVMITDFGMAKILGNGSIVTSTLCGTPQYVAPEVIRKAEDPSAQGYGLSCDMWSLGAILYFLLFRTTAFRGDGDNLVQQIKNGDYTVPQEQEENVSPEALDLIRGLLNVDPGVRLTAQQASMHPWLHRQDPDIPPVVCKRYVEPSEVVVAKRLRRTCDDD